MSGRRRAPWRRGWRRSGCRPSPSSTSGRRRIGRPEGRGDRGDGPRRPPADLGRSLAARPCDARRHARLVGGDERDRGVRGRPARGLRGRRHRRRSERRSPTPRPSCRSRTCARPTGERKRTGLSGSLIPERRRRHRGHRRGSCRCPTATPKGPTASRRRRSGDVATSATPAGAQAAGRAGAGESRRRALRRRRIEAGGPRPPAPHADALTAEGAARLQAELDELVKVSGPRSSGASRRRASTVTSRRTPSTTRRARSRRLPGGPDPGPRGAASDRPDRRGAGRRQPGRSRVDGHRRDRRRADRADDRGFGRVRDPAARAGSRRRHRSGGRCSGTRPARSRDRDAGRRARYRVSRSAEAEVAVAAGAPAARAGARYRVSSGCRPACARPRRARPGSARRARACPGCSRRRSGPSVR